MPIVTIRGQWGSLAPEIGQLTATMMDAEQVDWEIIESVASQLNQPRADVAAKEEPPSSLMGRIMESLARGSTFTMGAEGVHLPAWEIPLDDTRYLEALVGVVTHLAESANIVIRGRGSQFILKDNPKAFHVLVVAPSAVRTKRVMELMGVSEDAAQKEIERLDSSRRAFVKRYFQGDLEHPANYHLVVNTGRFTVEGSASMIVKGLDELKLR